ncbi:hypothetical protein [Sphingorhabdus sp. M41]|uniref:hypothetical protein n=1 Tax=Sphingorhabdus sp. M41 TaxID=1806885 RepID=UPI001E63F9EC|nr:hypothetical protein [Sphingorhabdus sp. M41]
MTTNLSLSGNLSTIALGSATIGSSKESFCAECAEATCALATGLDKEEDASASARVSPINKIATIAKAASSKTDALIRYAIFSTIAHTPEVNGVFTMDFRQETVDFHGVPQRYDGFRNIKEER